jgi:hypothetical protein
LIFGFVIAAVLLAGCLGGGGPAPETGGGGTTPNQTVAPTPTPEPEIVAPPVNETPEPQQPAQPEVVTAVPTAAGIESGQGGLTGGSAGWANNLGIARAKAWQSDAVLTHVDLSAGLKGSLYYKCGLRDTDLGAGWVLTYYSASNDAFYQVTVDFQGVNKQVEASSVYKNPISDWQMDSIALCSAVSASEGKTPSDFKMVTGNDGISRATITFKEGGMVSVKASDGTAA